MYACKQCADPRNTYVKVTLTKLKMSELAEQELRKCNLQAVVLALEGSHWKTLLCHIPLNLDSDNFVPKYNSDHIAIIENASVHQKRPCTELLFEEWGTSGKRRPTVRDLLKILVDAELFRAADIVSVEMLKGSPVERPKTGPAAKIDVSINRLIAENDMNKENMESFLNQISYPSSINANVDSFNKNLDNKNTKNNKSEKNIKYEKFNLNIPSNGHSGISNISAKSNMTNLSTSPVSDMIKFSSDQNVTASNNNYQSNEISNFGIPAISALLNEMDIIETKSQNNTTSDNIMSMNSNNDFNYSTSSNPNIEAINRNIPTDLNSYQSQNEMSETENSESNIPNLSLINQSFVEVIPVLSLLNQNPEPSSEYYFSQSEEFNVPVLSALQKSESDIQNQSINTHKLEFEYDQLKSATNSFNNDEYSGDLKGRKIGSGGFGTVYLANKPDGSLFIVKRLYDNSNDKHMKELIHKQFRNEIETLSHLSHDNIVSLLGYSHNGPYHCLVYEFIEGGSLLKNLAENSKLDAISRLHIAIGTAKALKYLHCAHSKPLIHRDVKSANILLTKQCIPKLCDFGLIRLSSDKTTTTNIIGTTAYMAPEAFRGDVSVKMDVFSFGVILLELLTSLPPMDESREGTDLITHVLDICSEDGIDSLLDKKAGPWHFAYELFGIAQDCLEDNKKKRPVISDVVIKLCLLLKNGN